MSRAMRRLKMASGFRANVFDPLLIVAQIAGLQCCFYISLGFWLFVADSIGDVHRTLDQIFNYRVRDNDFYFFVIIKMSSVGV